MGQHPAKAYVFSDCGEKIKAKALINLLQHKIKVYEAERDVKIKNRNFPKVNSYLVPGEQQQFRMVATMLDMVTEFYDSLFYHASAWSMVHAYGLPSSPLKSRQLKAGSAGEQIDSAFLAPKDFPVTKSDYAYVFSWQDYNLTRVLHEW